MRSLNFIGAMPETESPMRNTNGRTAEGALGSGPEGERDLLAYRRGEDADASALYVRTAEVRSVRRENRKSQSNGADRSVVVVDFVASTEIKDSHGSIVKSNWDLVRFAANPVLLWMHGRWSDIPAVGNVENLRKEGTDHCGRAVFDDTSDFDKEVAAKYEKGVLKAFSIGFYPHTVRFEMHNDEEVLILDDIELLEISCVNVPSNPEALAKEARSWEALRSRARAAKTPAPPAPTTPRATPGAPKDQTMKTITVDVRAHRASPQTAACPACNEALGVALANVPEVDEKALAEATSRAATAEQSMTVLTAKATEAERALALSASELQSATARLAALEPELALVRAENEKARTALVEKAIDERVSVRIFPTERDSELRIAKLLLADRTPDPEKPGATLGEKAFATRLAEIDARPDLGLLGPSLANANAAQNTGAGKSPEARSLASEIDEIVVKHQSAAA
jgi:HK97 family phage prohead protease